MFNFLRKHDWRYKRKKSRSKFMYYCAKCGASITVSNRLELPKRGCKKVSNKN